MKISRTEVRQTLFLYAVVLVSMKAAKKRLKKIVKE